VTDQSVFGDYFSLLFSPRRQQTHQPRFWWDPEDPAFLRGFGQGARG
jgi:hypothetical protein